MNFLDANALVNQFNENLAAAGEETFKTQKQKVDANASVYRQMHDYLFGLAKTSQGMEVIKEYVETMNASIETGDKAQRKALYKQVWPIKTMLIYIYRNEATECFDSAYLYTIASQLKTEE